MKKKYFFSFLLIMIVLLLLTLSLVLLINQKSEFEAKVYPVSIHKTRTLLLEGRSFTERIKIGAVGDILIHDWVYDDALLNRKYDFKPMFANVKEMLLKPDVLLANQETVLGGTELGLSSYPMFNSPHEVADALIDIGVDIVSTANNHSLDKGEKAIQSAIRYYEKKNLPYVGSYKDAMDQQSLRIIEKNGIKLCYLSYTYGTNGIPVPQGKDYLVNIIDKEKMAKQIKRARNEADVVIMSLHWGNEYQRIPSKEQKELAAFLVNEGVDIIFGHHPHVLQPMEWITAKDGRKGFVVYSLGNFLSGQMRDYKDIGGLATLDITKIVSPEGTKIFVENAQFQPTFVSNKHLKQYKVLPMQQAEAAGMLQAEVNHSEILAHMKQWLP